MATMNVTAGRYYRWKSPRTGEVLFELRIFRERFDFVAGTTTPMQVKVRRINVSTITLIGRAKDREGELVRWTEKATTVAQPGVAIETGPIKDPPASRRRGVVIG